MGVLIKASSCRKVISVNNKSKVPWYREQRNGVRTHAWPITRQTLRNATPHLGNSFRATHVSLCSQQSKPYTINVFYPDKFNVMWNYNIVFTYDDHLDVWDMVKQLFPRFVLASVSISTRDLQRIRGLYVWKIYSRSKNDRLLMNANLYPFETFTASLTVLKLHGCFLLFCL